MLNRNLVIVLIGRRVSVQCEFALIVIKKEIYNLMTELLGGNAKISRTD